MIGDHTVLLIPDPDVQAWGPQLASNPLLTTDLAGWGPAPFGKVWTWVDGGAVGTAQPDPDPYRSWKLIRQEAAPILRDASPTYRVRSVLTVPAATPLLVGMYLGTTPGKAWGGPFFYPDDSVSRYVTVNAPTAGTYTVDAVISVGDLPATLAYLAPYAQVWPGNRAFPSPPRVESVELQGQGGESIDLTCLVDQVTIHHGRDDTDSQPEAATCTLDLALDSDVDILPAVEVGGIIRVSTNVLGNDSPRFVGRVTDLALGWDEAGEDTPDRLVAQVVAASTMADLGRRVVGDVPWPQELDGARVARIMSAAGVTLDPTFSDPGTVAVIARDVDSQAALAVAQDVAADARGVVWHTRSGDVRYADAAHRRGATTALALDACDVLVTPTWRRTTEGLVNDVSVGYGPLPDAGEQPRYLADNPTSVGRYGRYDLSVATQLAALADATALGQMLLVRNAYPVWVLDQLPVDMKGLDTDQTIAVLALDMHALVSVTGLPVAGEAPTSAALWVEGWTERLGFGEHDLELSVSGYCRTAPAPRWDDVDPAWTWDTTNPATLTWDDTTCMGPQPNRGRWSDVPASLRWDQVPPATKWDDWK